jgi:TRAP-type C4-dicarboxylate transport system permease large subunit
MSAVILFIVAAASGFSYALTTQQILHYLLVPAFSLWLRGRLGFR